MVATTTDADWRLYGCTSTGAGLWEYFLDGVQVASLMTRDGTTYSAIIVQQVPKLMLATLHVTAHKLAEAQAEVENIVRDSRKRL